MADINNFTEIAENFDTIKTLLNSIRAQGILNTSDVDRLLSGINAKLEKINTDEDIDLIKIFLSELKQNFDERHGVLISKFGAIESLFSNLLKNSSDTLKSSEAKELFDIVATNLSVFSREVVSQKDILTDITLRLDAMRSDDSTKKDIIKNIALLKNDLDRLSNGFDSIVLSLNENFKTVIKTISSIDQSEAINKFGEELSDIASSSNTVLSALQMLDKKNLQLEEILKTLATQDDVKSVKKWLNDLVTQNHELTGAVDNLTDRYYKIDNLAEKIDASVNIIAGLKTVIADNDEQNTQVVIDKLAQLELALKEVTEDESFDEFKKSMEVVLNDILASSENLKNVLLNTSSEIQKINSGIAALDINVNFQGLNTNLKKTEQEIKEHVNVAADKISQLVEVNVTRTLNDISSNADTLGAKLAETNRALTGLCEKSFGELAESLSGLKNVVSQIDENNVSANNAIFSNITDRLTMFENSLKTSLEKQEESVVNTSAGLVEQIANIKNLSGVLDYKMDASVIEVNNAKREFADLKSAVEAVLALDFVNTVKDLRVDLYAIKQDLSGAVEASSADISEKFSNDLFGKYELLVSKLDNVEDELKQEQKGSLSSMKVILDNISASIMDILSYVSEKSEINTDSIDIKLANITETVKESNLNYVENVRDIVEVIRKQVENNLVQIQKDTVSKVDSINGTITQNTEALRQEIKYSYNKLLEVKDDFADLKGVLDSNNTSFTSNIEEILNSTEKIKEDFEAKISALKAALLDKISEFQQEFTCENADKISEIKFSSENMHAKSLQKSIDLKNELRDEITGIIDSLNINVQNLTERLGLISENIETTSRDYISGIDVKTDKIVKGFNELKQAVNDLSATSTNSLTASLAQILDNFVSMKAVISNLNEKSAADLKSNIDVISEEFGKLREEVLASDSNIDEDLSRQLSIIETGFKDLTAALSDMFEKSDLTISSKMGAGFETMSAQMSDIIAQKLSSYSSSIDNLFEGFSSKNKEQAEFIRERVLELNKTLEESLVLQKQSVLSGLDEITAGLKGVLDENLKLSMADYKSLKSNLAEFASKLERENTNLAESFKAQFDDITKFMDSVLDIQSQEVNVKFEEISKTIQNVTGTVIELNNDVKSRISTINGVIENLKTGILSSADENAGLIVDKLEALSNNYAVKNDAILSAISDNCGLVTDKLDTLSKESAAKNDAIISAVSNNSGLVINRLEALSDDLSSKDDTLVSSLMNISTSSRDEIKSGITSGVKDLSALLDIHAGEIREAVEASANNLQNDTQENINNGVRSLSTLMDAQLQEIRDMVDTSASSLRDNTYIQVKNVLDELEKVNNLTQNQSAILKNAFSTEISSEVSGLYDRIQNLFEEQSVNYMTLLGNTNAKYIEELNSQAAEFKASFESLNERLDKDEISQVNLFQEQVRELSSTFNVLIEEAKSVTKSEVAAISQTLINNSKVLFEDVEQSIENKVNSILATNADIAAGELQSIETFTNQILAEIEAGKQNTNVCRDVIAELVKNEFEALAGEIEKETDVIVKDLIEQFGLMKDLQKDELSKLTVHIETSVEDYIYNYINDLKSYLDVKTDSSVLNTKLDNLKTDLDNSVEDVLSNINKMLEATVFSSAMTEMKTANEILATSMVDKLNRQIQDFVLENVTTDINCKLDLIDKNLADTIVNKYEDIKQFVSAHGVMLESLQSSMQGMVNQFAESKNDISASLQSIIGNIGSAVDGINSSIKGLNLEFADLKAQILNKSFDEAFQASLNNQITGIENLIKEQLGYLEDIGELCGNNLPELTEMNTIVKHGIMHSIEELSAKFDSGAGNTEEVLNNFKSDIITQFINIFNQISFVAEQEEILDFIQEKHSELITILSHIVTTVDSVDTVKDNVAVIDSKLDSVKEDISSINSKINAIISSEGDVNYVYSLQDLESDIANLRLVLNEMKEDNKSKEFDELISSTNDIYKLVESIKTEMPKFELEEFKRDFNALNEDIISISTRTNKLILASDESYKTLQDNLQDFKLVINDLDERTRNFAHEAGIDRIDNKLGSINAMIQNGAKTNQVFNQVFEYLAEWVDKAGAQITAISDKVETLDDIGQIKVMLEDLKAEAEDSSESNELIEALGNIFEKQAKRISSLEAKLDRVIVETTINNKNNKIDMTPFEETLNRFLVAIDDRMNSQQAKINSLEAKLEEAVSKIDPKDTAQLTKKVGGMDRQIAKLNKSIEKIASHVVEK